MPTLTAATYNVKCDYPSPGELGWPERRDAVCRVVRSLDPDVLGLQEALSHQLSDIAEALPGHDVVGVGRDDGDQEGEFSPLLLRRGVVRVVASGTVWVSATPSVPGSLGPGAGCPRLVTWADVVCEGRVMRIANTHLDHESAEARLLGAQIVAGLGPDLVTGDFNCGPEEEPVGHLQGLGYRLAPIEPLGTATFTDWDARLALGPQLDHVLVRGVSVSAARVERRVVDGVLPSDHHAVWAVVSW